MASAADSQESGPSKEVPDRLASNAPEHPQSDDEDEDIDVTAPKTRGALYMNQSFISLIANAGSKGNFNTPFSLDLSDEDGTSTFGRRPTGTHRYPQYGSSRRGRESGDKMLHSMPGLNRPPRKSRDFSPELDPMAESQILIPPTTLDPQPQDAASVPRISEPIDTTDGSQEDEGLRKRLDDTRSSTPDQPEAKETLSDRIAQIFGLKEKEDILSGELFSPKHARGLC